MLFFQNNKIYYKGHFTRTPPNCNVDFSEIVHK